MGVYVHSSGFLFAVQLNIIRNGVLLQIKKNNVFDSWNVLWFTCIERALIRSLDIQDACNAPQIINKWSRSLHLL